MKRKVSKKIVSLIALTIAIIMMVGCGTAAPPPAAPPTAPGVTATGAPAPAAPVAPGAPAEAAPPVVDGRGPRHGGHLTLANTVEVAAMYDPGIASARFFALWFDHLFMADWGINDPAVFPMTEN